MQVQNATRDKAASLIAGMGKEVKVMALNALKRKGPTGEKQHKAKKARRAAPTINEAVEGYHFTGLDEIPEDDTELPALQQASADGGFAYDWDKVKGILENKKHPLHKVVVKLKKPVDDFVGLQKINIENGGQPLKSDYKRVRKIITVKVWCLMPLHAAQRLRFEQWTLDARLSQQKELHSMLLVAIMSTLQCVMAPLIDKSTPIELCDRS